MYTDRYDHVNISSAYGGSVLSTIKCDFPASKIDFDFPETILVKTNLNTTTNIYILNVYIPPNSNINYYNDFFQLIEDFQSTLHGDLMIIGDFNISEFPWDDYKKIFDLPTNIQHTSPFNICNHSLRTQSLFNFMIAINAKQYNFNKNIYGTILDLIIFSNQNCSINIEVSPQYLVTEDNYHPTLKISCHINNRSPNRYTIPIHNFL